jgi:hypothetical protein
MTNERKSRAGKPSPQAAVRKTTSEPKRDRTARLIFLSHALMDVELLLHCADCWLPREECDAMAAEMEVAIRAIAACIEKRVPPVIIPTAIAGNGSRIDELVENSLAGMRKEFALIDRIVPECIARPDSGGLGGRQ